MSKLIPYNFEHDHKSRPEEAMLRLYVQANTKAHDAAAEVLRRFALVPMLQRDWQGTYLDVTPPKTWPVERRQELMAAIEQLDWL